MKNRSGNGGFIGATSSLIAIFAASASPIPFYNTYRQIAGLRAHSLT